VSYLLGTNVCIALINGKPEAVRIRFEAEVQAGESMRVSAVSVFELLYGAAKSAQMQANRACISKFLAGPIEVASFDEADARLAGQLRADLEKRGRPIGAYDLLVAGQALRNNLVLVTANVCEFGHITDLKWQNWSKHT
jgi:tRNA(fMet)-specific endonuclease VapC